MHAGAPGVELGAHDRDAARVEARLEVVEQLLEALDALGQEHLLPGLARLLAVAPVGAADAAVGVREAVAELVGLAGRLVERPQVLLDLDVAAAQPGAERLGRRGRARRAAGELHQLVEVGALGGHARPARVAARGAQLQLELVGRLEALVRGQQRVARGRPRVVDERVQLGDAPAEQHRGRERAFG